MNKIVLGLGNTILTDDGVGIHVVRALRNILTDPKVTLVESELAGFSLIELLEGFELAVIIDAFIQPDRQPGLIRWFNYDTNYRCPTFHLVAGHQIDLDAAVKIGRRLCDSFPSLILIIAITIKDATTFSEQCSVPVQKAILPAAELACRMLENPHQFSQ
ncbi:hydrogenase maturation protease [bacterium]|nr:hydrogenase maturation protease [bacterium]